MVHLDIPHNIVAQFREHAPDGWVRIGVMREQMQGDDIVESGIDIVAVWTPSGIETASTTLLPAQLEFETLDAYLETLPTGWRRLEFFISINGDVKADLATGQLRPADYLTDDAFFGAFDAQAKELEALGRQFYGEA